MELKSEVLMFDDLRSIVHWLDAVLSADETKEECEYLARWSDEVKEAESNQISKRAAEAESRQALMSQMFSLLPTVLPALVNLLTGSSTAEKEKVLGTRFIGTPEKTPEDQGPKAEPPTPPQAPPNAPQKQQVDLAIRTIGNGLSTLNQRISDGFASVEKKHGEMQARLSVLESTIARLVPASMSYVGPLQATPGVPSTAAPPPQAPSPGGVSLVGMQGPLPGSPPGASQ